MILVVIYLVQNLWKTSITIVMTKYNHFTHIALVLDDSAPIDDVDGGWSLVGDLGDLHEPLDVLEEGEELSVGDRIE